MLITSDKVSFSRYAEILGKLSNYLLGIALLCYLTGFAITNMYLGSLGIVNLDILRARYIMTGFLFLIFLSGIVYLVYGLFQTLRTYRHLTGLDLIWKVMGYSIQRIAVLYWVIPAIAIFAGIRGSPIDTLRLSSPFNWSLWLTTEPLSVFQRAAWLIGILLSAIILVISFVIIVINPKNKYGIRQPRKQVLTEMLHGIRKEWHKAIGFFFGMFTLAFIFFLISSLLSVIATNKVNSTVTITWLAEGWSQFFVVTAIIYVLIASYLTFMFIFSSSNSDEQDPTPLAKTSAWLYFVSIGILIVIPVYTFGIYPHLPQHFGGGKVLQVEVTVSGSELKTHFMDSTNTYLIDRTSNSSIFLLFKNEKIKIIEISSSMIQSVIYSLSP